ncbi:MAG: NHL repeat-containing protein [Candidatus Eisenbacteria bacterium]|nr:NHL repeat-containing protein [Candidatus Eisenbacteria bacterium]
MVNLPGETDELLRPQAVAFDPAAKELVLAEAGHNRILVFDAEGTYRFEFRGGSRFGAPLDVAIDPLGRILVLGSTPEGSRLFLFDFDGLFLATVGQPEDLPAHASSFAVDDEGSIYLLDPDEGVVVVLDAGGRRVRSFPVGVEREPRPSEVGYGSIERIGDCLYVPITPAATVEVFSLAGKFLRTVGYGGNNIGELNFPVAVAGTDEGLLLVLDKHRYAVLCFDREGTFLGEFGGLGSSPGWFYHPTLLATDGKEIVYVGQWFEGKVQMCRVPRFIREANAQAVGIDPDSGYAVRR